MPYAPISSPRSAPCGVNIQMEKCYLQHDDDNTAIIQCLDELSARYQTSNFGTAEIVGMVVAVIVFVACPALLLRDLVTSDRK